MNKTELNNNVASVFFKGELNTEKKCITEIELKVCGNEKELTFLFSKAFEESPQFFDLMKTAIEFVEFKKSMKSTHEKFSEALGKDIDGLSGIFKDGGPVGFGRLMKELFEKVDAKRDGKI